MWNMCFYSSHSLVVSLQRHLRVNLVHEAEKGIISYSVTLEQAGRGVYERFNGRKQEERWFYIRVQARAV